MRLLEYAVWVLIAGLACMFYKVAYAETVWTPQPGIYYQYKVPPRMTNQYELTIDIEIPAHWIKQAGEFTKMLSGGGATKYEKIAVTVPPNNPVCEAQFVCHDKWGWVVDLSHNSVLQCPRVRITKEQALFYEGHQIVNGAVVCP